MGATHESVTVLTRQDWWHFQGKPWRPDSGGLWLLENPKADSSTAEIILSSKDHDGGEATLNAVRRVQARWN